MILFLLCCLLFFFLVMFQREREKGTALETIKLLRVRTREGKGFVELSIRYA